MDLNVHQKNQELYWEDSWQEMFRWQNIKIGSMKRQNAIFHQICAK